jgi:hypothetical protein
MAVREVKETWGSSRINNEVLIFQWLKGYGWWIDSFEG